MASKGAAQYLKRSEYWADVLGIDWVDFLDLAEGNGHDLDAWVKDRYAEQLKTAEVMARLLAGRNK